MTPNDIATSVAGTKPVGEGSVTLSTNYTYSWGKLDDANTWD